MEINSCPISLVGCQLFHGFRRIREGGILHKAIDHTDFKGGLKVTERGN